MPFLWQPDGSSGFWKFFQKVGLRLYAGTAGYFGLKLPATVTSTDYQVPTGPPTTDGQGLVSTAAGVLGWSGTAGAYTVMGNNGSSPSVPVASSAIQIGNLGNVNSVDPVITASRNINSGSSNGHCFSDSSFFDRNTFAYCSYDARITLGASGHTYAHYAPFQSLPSLLAGTLTNYDGFYSEVDAATGSTVTNANHFQAHPSGISNFVDGAGSVVNHYVFGAATALGASGTTAFGSASQFVLYSPDQANLSVHAGPFFFGYGTQASGGYAGAITGTSTSIEICQNCYYDPARANYYPLTANSSYVIMEPHLPGSNSFVCLAGPTPSSLNSPIATKPIALEFGYNSFNAGANYYGFSRIGDHGPIIYSSIANVLQFGNITAAAPAIKVNAAALNFRLADDSADCTITAATQTTGDNSTNVATTAFIAATLASLEGAHNGIATLDSSGKLTAAQIPASLVGALQYQGTWNATTNSPTLVSSTGTKGQYYKVSVAGSTTIDTISQWNIGDTIVFDGTVWDKIDGISSEVVTVAGRTGVVTLANTDVGLGSVTNDAQTKAAIVPNTVPSSGQMLIGNAGAYAAVTMSGDATITSAGVVTVTKKRVLATFAKDNGSSVILAGTHKMIVCIPYAATITEWTLQADQSASVTIDVYKQAYSTSTAPSVSVVGTGSKPSLSTARNNKGLVSDWSGTLAVTAYDQVTINISSPVNLTGFVFELVGTG